MPAPPIPSYALFGELAADDRAGFVHIETIARRSALTGWEITAHRHMRFHQLLLLEHGGVEAQIDTLTFKGVAPVVLIAPAGTVHSFRFAAETVGWVLTVSVDFLSRPEDPDDPLHGLARSAAFPLASPALEQPAMLYRCLIGVQERSPGDVRLHLSLAESAIRATLAAVDHGQVPADRRLTRLVALVEAHYREGRPISDYADAMAMTRRSLARLTAARLGCSPATLIERRRILEARRLLRFSNVSISELADYLGYADSSYFARAFRRATGRSPRAERLAANA